LGGHLTDENCIVFKKMKKPVIELSGDVIGEHRYNG